MTRYTLTIGLFDKDTKKQKISSDVGKFSWGVNNKTDDQIFGAGTKQFGLRLNKSLNQILLLAVVVM